MTPAPESANGGGTIAVLLFIIFVVVIAVFGGFVDMVVNALPQVMP